jgi:TolB-like protein
LIPELLRFGPFELNPRTGELTKRGRRLPLSPQPARLLALLASRPGDLVTRDEIRQHLWPHDVVVDFDLGLNSCLAHLRALLGDRARHQRYIETLPRRGYRFVAPVQRSRSFTEPTIAVLPFVNLGRDPSLEYFADGMTDALITELASISALRVISRQTVLHLKGSEKPLAAIVRELGVDAVVEGTVLADVSTIRITAQLVSTTPERHIWAQMYESAPTDILSIHRRVARAVAEGVDAALTPSELARLSHPVRVHPKAYEAYLKGRFHAADWSREGFGRALASFEEAIRIDTSYAPPHAALGGLFANLGYWGHMPLAPAFGRAKQEALAALSLDEGLGAAHTTLAWVNWFHEWDLDACDRERRRALELFPGDPETLVMSGMFRLAACDEREAGLNEIEQALNLDPLSPVMNFCLAWNYVFAGDVDRAREQARETLKLFPSSVQALYALGITESSLGRPEDAIAALEKATAIARDPLSLGYLGYAYGVAGHTDKARRLLAEVTDASHRTFVAHKPFIVLHLGLREVDRALDYLEAASRVRDPILFHVTRVPIFEPLCEEPRFRAVMDRVPTLGQRGASRDQPIGQRPASQRSEIPESRKAARRSARSTAPS